MNRIKGSWIIAGVFLLSSGHFNGVFADAKQETQLKDVQTEIDQHSVVWSDEHHARTLASNYKVPVSAVRELSAKNQGWGAVTIELAMASELNTMHTQQFPFMTDALKGVEDLRVKGIGWGEIATRRGFGLSQVVEQTQDNATELREDDLAMSRRHEEHAQK